MMGENDRNNVNLLRGDNEINRLKNRVLGINSEIDRLIRILQSKEEDAIRLSEIIKALQKATGRAENLPNTALRNGKIDSKIVEQECKTIDNEIQQAIDRLNQLINIANQYMSTDNRHGLDLWKKQLEQVGASIGWKSMVSSGLITAVTISIIVAKYTTLTFLACSGAGLVVGIVVAGVGYGMTKYSTEYTNNQSNKDLSIKGVNEAQKTKDYIQQTVNNLLGEIKGYDRSKDDLTSVKDRGDALLNKPNIKKIDVNDCTRDGALFILKTGYMELIRSEERGAYIQRVISCVDPQQVQQVLQKCGIPNQGNGSVTQNGIGMYSTNNNTSNNNNMPNNNINTNNIGPIMQ